jgi:GTPase-associated protein 1, N-terminal domain type 1/Effector-associated domain 1
MLLGHAIFGEKNRGHALLGASPAATIASEIVGRMDLAGTQPPGTSWGPYVSGFRHEGHYVVARTSNDSDAQRNGMVFSRAFILPLDEAAMLVDIGGLFDLLANMVESRESVVDLKWVPNVPTAHPSAALAEALLADGNGPVIWPKQEGFEEAIAGLWCNLWPAARAGFSFGLAFRPQDLAASSPLIIAVPDSLAGRWGDYRHAASTSSPLDAAASLLVGAAEGAPLRKLMAELEADVRVISDLQQLADLQTTLANESKFETEVAALRNAAYLSPTSDLGLSLKRKLLARAIDAMSSASADSLLMTRNLNLSAFGASASFWKNVAAWTEQLLWDSAEHTLAAQIIRTAFADGGALAEWRKAVKNGIDVALAANQNKMIDGVWRIAMQAADIIELLAFRTSDLNAFEAALVARTPRRIDTDAGAAMMKIAVSPMLRRLHAAIAASSLRPHEAADAHIANPHHDVTTLQIALRHASPKDTINVALGREDEDLFAIAGALAAQDHKLLAPLALGKKQWRAIWRQALERDPSAWDGPRASRGAANVLWSELDNGDSEAWQLLRPLASTPLADISAHPARTRLWDRIPADLKPSVLAKTAEGAAAAFLSVQFDEGIEDLLSAELAKPQHCDAMLAKLVGEPARGAALFRLLPQLDEPRFRRWCDDVLEQNRCLSVPDSESFGRLIAARSWQNTASYFATLALAFTSPRSDLRPALRNSLELVGYVDRWFLGMSSAPAHQTRWVIFEELAINLYHTGPSHDELWSRAGGKNSKLPLQGNGAQKWRHVLDQARNGKLDIKMADLVQQMHIDYPANLALTKLQSEGLF